MSTSGWVQFAHCYPQDLTITIDRPEKVLDPGYIQAFCACPGME